MFAAVLSFAVVAGSLTVVPGLDTSLVLRAAIVQGRRAGFVTALGVNIGLLVWGVAAAGGLSVLLTASRVAFDVVRLAGAAYLIVLGAVMIYRTFRGSSQNSSQEHGPVGAAAASTRRVLSRAVTSNLLNPKIGAFYVVMLPQFLPAHESHLLAGVLLALVHVIERMLWYSVLIHGADRVRARLRGTAQRVIDRVSGAILIGFGVKLAVSRAS